MITAQDFKQQIIDNPNDTTIRYVYADWLEEQGETVEAERQRQWCQAKQWLVDFCDRYAQELSRVYGNIGLPVNFDEMMIAIGITLRGVDLRSVSRNKALVFGGFAWKCTQTLRIISNKKKVPGLWLFFGPHDTFKKAFCGEQGAVFWKNWCIVSGAPLDEEIDKFLYSVFKIN